MGNQLEQSDLVSFKELLMANSIQVDTAVQLFIEKRFFTEHEFFNKLKQLRTNDNVHEVSFEYGGSFHGKK
jgi:hypothetical protein